VRATRSVPLGGTALVRGRDHERIGAYGVARIGTSLAVGSSAGAKARPLPPLDGNEDVGAIVDGARADLIVVADGHFGGEASEAAVDRVLAVVGDDPPPAGLSDEEIVAVFFDAGIAVRQAVTRPSCPHPDSRTTLALALIGDRDVQWAAFGDSSVFALTTGRAARLDSARGAYLGDRYELAEVSTILSRGRIACNDVDCIVLATDGLTDALGAPAETIADAASAELRKRHDAVRVVDVLIDRALQQGADDAVTVAVALT
jgi:serine/threonine protein phosphatase PrpC